MDALTRMQTILRLEGKPDRVGTFLQGPMPLFTQNYWKAYEDSVRDEDVVWQPQDLTIWKHMGFDAGWIWQPSASLNTSIDLLLLQASVPRIAETESISPLQGIFTTTTMDGLPYTWWTSGLFDRFQEVLNEPRKSLDVQKGLSSASDMREHCADVVEHFGDFITSWIKGIEVVPIDDAWIECFAKGMKVAYAQDFVPVPAIHGVFEHAHMMVGDAGLARMLRGKRLVNALDAVLDCEAKLNTEKMRASKAAGVKIACVADDCAYKNRPMLSPTDYERLIIPRLKQITKPALGATCQSNEPLLFFHSDGFTEPYFRSLATFVNGIESLEPKAGMDLAALKQSWGRQVALLGNLDVGLLEFATPREVALATKKCLDSAKAGGGYVFCPCTDIPNRARIENVEAMMLTVKKHGFY
jgi:hypothetical protein